jgi:pentatricopeptide repeat protein
VCDEAAGACKGQKPKAAAEFAARLLPLFAAAKTKAPASEAAIRGGKQAVPMVRQWLAERAVLGRAENAATFIRLLCKAGQIDDARKVCGEEMEWTARNFTSPAGPVKSLGLDKRQMSPTARRALYMLLLAQGEVDLADNEFEKSADRFGEAAAIYEKKVEDHADINRLLRAKFNQANSLLRIKRIDEAIGIYDLCEHGFHSIGDTQAAQRVAHAKLFAQSLAADDDDS